MNSISGGNFVSPLLRRLGELDRPSDGFPRWDTLAVRLLNFEDLTAYKIAYTAVDEKQKYRSNA